MTEAPPDAADTVRTLRNPATIRARCAGLLFLAEQDRLLHLTFHPDRMEAAADYVAGVIRANYPDLRIPYHARWRHFELDGVSEWDAIAPADPDKRARAALDLCTVSVLLDAGAGAAWRYTTSSGKVLSRSEGLAIASLDAFRAGLFSGNPAQPLQADADGLARLTPDHLAKAFQVTGGNPLEGLEGRVTLLQRLGLALRAQPALFGPEARPGGLFDHWRALSRQRPLRAADDVLGTVLHAFADIWPGRITLHGENLGDVWQHPLLPDGTLVPFHKLSQWLGYSLIEALETASVQVHGIDELTGLAEYRNGGLFLDLGVLSLRDPPLASTALPPAHPAIVEWRALTVALLDRLAPLLRTRLGGDAQSLPLARLLQGGTWDAGRRIARERRPGGPPPLTVQSDGTVF